MSEKLVNFRWDEEKYETLKDVARKERRDIKDVIGDVLDDYIKAHADGNPQFTIDQFEDPNFVACPAFYRDATVWENYIKQATPEELEKLKNQVILIDRKLTKWI